jgi:hypothetical protein
MRRQLLFLALATVVVVVGLAVVAYESDDDPEVLPQSDLPSARAGAAISIAPRVIPPGFQQTVHIEAPSGLTYGQSYEIDEYVNGSWRYILIGGQPPNEASVSRPSSRKQEPVFTAEVFSGPSTFKLSVAEGPGDYRIRKAMIDPGPGDDFEVAVTFRIKSRSD